MNEPHVTISLDGNGRVYRPGETLSGEYRLGGFRAEEVKAVEVSVLWYTVGKGDEDLAVHDFWRSSPDESDCHPLHRPHRFSTRLPNSPWSYNGVIVKIRWCVRVRVFQTHGKDVVGDLVFRLGDLSAARPVAAGIRNEG